MKLKSKKLESICKEFAQKIYILLSIDDKDYLFNKDEVQEESILMLQHLERAWDDIAVPTLKEAASRMTNQEYIKFCKKYNFEKNQDIQDIAMERIEQLLAEHHKSYVEKNPPIKDEVINELPVDHVRNWLADHLNSKPIQLLLVGEDELNWTFTHIDTRKSYKVLKHSYKVPKSSTVA